MHSSTANVDRLTRRFNQLHTEVLSFVQTCSPGDWDKIISPEGWPVSVTARHIATAHYPVIQWMQMVIQGNPLPPVTADTVDQLNAQHAAEHGGCTQEEVAELLRINHAEVTAYLQTIDDLDLERQSYLKLFDKEISAAQLFTAILIDAARKHWASIQATVRP